MKFVSVEDTVNHSFDDSPMPSKSVTDVNGKRTRSYSPQKKQDQSAEHGRNLVGSWIKIWWPEDKTYHEGVVKSFSSKKKKHKVLYDIGDEEFVNLKKEQWELTENVSPMSDCVIPPLSEKVSSPQSDIICVQGYMVKNNIAPILEAIFKKHGDIAADCLFKPASVRATLLEVVCEAVGRIETIDCTTIVSEIEEIESQVSVVEAAKVNVSWLQAHLKAFHKRTEAMKKSSLLMEMKTITTLVNKAAQKDLTERCAEVMAAQERFQQAKKCMRVLDLVEMKLNNDILESKAEKDSWVKHPIL